MLKIENLVTPSPEQFYVALSGMRNAFKSWDKSDSFYITDLEKCRREGKCDNCPYHGDVDIDRYWCWARVGEYSPFVLGEKDKQLLINLCKAGDPSHRKVLRQLPVIMDITAPEYWWRQMDQYKVGTVTNSTSQMHTLNKKELVIKDFSIPEESSSSYKASFQILLNTINGLINEYNETKDKEYWNEALALIPQSFNYTRTWSANYEVLLNIIQQRKNHKLIEWTDFSNYMLEHVPYLKEIYEAVNEN